MKKQLTTINQLGSICYVLASATSAQAAIAFLPVAGTPVGANVSVVYTGDPSFRAGTEFDGMTTMGTFENITLTMTADIAGTWVNATQFRNTSAITSGQTVVFSADANMLLQADKRADAPFANNRTAFSLNTIATGNYDITVTGGNETMYEYYVNQTTPMMVGDTNYGTIWMDDARYEGGTPASTITGVPTVGSPDTIALTGGGGQYAFLGDYGGVATDLSFKTIVFSYTADAEIAANTIFSFTFEGNNVAQQLAVIPEPSGAILGVLGLGSLALVRRRKAS